MVIGIGIEVAIVAICINVFGMGEGSTYCFVLAALCIVLAYAAYHHDTPTPEVNQSQEVQEDERGILHCPHCFSTNTIMSENGIGFCYDCKSYWRVENLL